GTLGSQYAAVLANGRRALDTVPNNGQLQKALVEKNHAEVAAIAEDASGGGLRITVKDPAGKYLTPVPNEDLQPIGTPRAIGSNPTIASVAAWVDPGELIKQIEQADDDVM